MEIFEKDCLVRIGTCIAPKGPVEADGSLAATVKLDLPDGSSRTEEIKQGEIRLISLGEGQFAEAEIKPRSNLDIGAGPGKELEAKIEGGVVGIMLDGRGRPLALPEDDATRRRQLVKWFRATDAYPQAVLDRYEKALVR
jgi:hypothetical protein